VDESKIKEVRIPNGYILVYCSCMEHDLQREVVGKIRSLGIPVREISNFDQLKQIQSSRNFVLFSMERKVDGTPRKYNITRLVSRSESSSCGKNCSYSRQWNELVVKAVSTSGKTKHESVMLYRIDEGTELMLALNSGERYSIRLTSDAETGTAENIIEESRTYEFTH
jgi:hypothetical protein